MSDFATVPVAALLFLLIVIVAAMADVVHVVRKRLTLRKLRQEVAADTGLNEAAQDPLKATLKEIEAIRVKLIRYFVHMDALVAAKRWRAKDPYRNLGDCKLGLRKLFMDLGKQVDACVALQADGLYLAALRQANVAKESAKMVMGRISSLDPQNWE